MFERQVNKAMLHNMHLLESVQLVARGLVSAGISNMPEAAVVLPGCCQELYLSGCLWRC